MTSSKDSRRHSDHTQANKGQQQSGHKGHGKDKDMDKDAKRPNMPDEDEEDVVNEAGSDMDPEKKTQIDDNPDETRKKIPHMRK
jgi:hypothetical protein